MDQEWRRRGAQAVQRARAMPERRPHSAGAAARGTRASLEGRASGAQAAPEQRSSGARAAQPSGARAVRRPTERRPYAAQCRTTAVEHSTNTAPGRSQYGTVERNISTVLAPEQHQTRAAQCTQDMCRVATRYQCYIVCLATNTSVVPVQHESSTGAEHKRMP